MIVVFSGSRQPMKTIQEAMVARLLGDFPSRPRRIVMHGCCTGSDAQFHAIAREQGWFIVGCPGKPIGHEHRANLECDELWEVQAPLKRNAIMVSHADFFIAAPKEFEQPESGGTWFSIDKARAKGVGRRIVYPDGSIDTERTWGQDTPQIEQLELVASPTRAPRKR